MFFQTTLKNVSFFSLYVIFSFFKKKVCSRSSVNDLSAVSCAEWFESFGAKGSSSIVYETTQVSRRDGGMAKFNNCAQFD